MGDTCTDSGAEVFPPARATVPPSLRDEPCTGRSAWLPLGRACLSAWIEHRSGERRSPSPGPSRSRARGSYALANAGHDTRALQAWLGHKNIQHTVRYTELAPDRFKDFWR
jgi:integrase